MFDLHPALHAADLQVAWSSEHGLAPIGSPHGYYTGDSLVSSPWLQSFEVLGVLPWDDRKIRNWLRSAGVGQVEVKSRGLYPLRMQLDANACQRRYSVAAGMPLTLLVTRIGERLRGIADRARRVCLLARDSSRMMGDVRPPSPRARTSLPRCNH